MNPPLTDTPRNKPILKAFYVWSIALSLYHVAQILVLNPLLNLYTFYRHSGFSAHMCNTSSSFKTISRGSGANWTNKVAVVDVVPTHVTMVEEYAPRSLRTFSIICPNISLFITNCFLLYLFYLIHFLYLRNFFGFHLVSLPFASFYGN